MNWPGFPTRPSRPDRGTAARALCRQRRRLQSGARFRGRPAVSPGVYVVANGTVFPADRVRENPALNRLSGNNRCFAAAAHFLSIYRPGSQTGQAARATFLSMFLSAVTPAPRAARAPLQAGTCGQRIAAALPLLWAKLVSLHDAAGRIPWHLAKSSAPRNARRCAWRWKASRVRRAPAGEPSASSVIARRCCCVPAMTVTSSLDSPCWWSMTAG
jgi:hypothetical protein